MQLITSTEKEEETWVSATPFVDTEIVIWVVAIPIEVSTVMVPLESILIPLTDGLIVYEVESTTQFVSDEDVEVVIVGRLWPSIVV